MNGITDCTVATGKKICMFAVTRPSLLKSTDPKHFSRESEEFNSGAEWYQNEGNLHFFQGKLFLGFFDVLNFSLSKKARNPVD